MVLFIRAATMLLRAPTLLLLLRQAPVALHKLPAAGPRLMLEAAAGARCMGTRGRNEPKEPLNSPKGAKEFIYRLQPAERRCLLHELQTFESIAVAQGRRFEGGASPPLPPASLAHTHTHTPYQWNHYTPPGVMIHKCVCRVKDSHAPASSRLLSTGET